MNKIQKVIVAILASLNNIMTLLMPLSVGLLILSTTKPGNISGTLIMVVAIGSTIFRASRLLIEPYG